MTNPSFSEELLRTINEKHISPKPRWEFWVRDWAVWTAGVISILVGGLAVGLIITAVRSDDFLVLKQNTSDDLNIAMMLIPYFWIFVLIGFLFIAGLNLKHTKRGYRIRLPIFAAVVVGLSIVLGICFYDAGLGQFIEESIADHPVPYARFIQPRMQLWSHPDMGTLGGTVLAIPDDQTILLMDFSNRPWIIHVMNDRINVESIPIQARVRCLGLQITNDEFDAVQILPWGNRRTIILPLPPPPDHQFFEVP